MVLDRRLEHKSAAVSEEAGAGDWILIQAHPQVHVSAIAAPVEKWRGRRADQVYVAIAGDVVFGCICHGASALLNRSPISIGGPSERGKTHQSKEHGLSKGFRFLTYPQRGCLYKSSVESKG